MTYDQYSINAQTGAPEAGKNRLSSNSNDSSSETVLWPAKFDLLTNKENSSLSDFSVTEEHASGDISSTLLYLDHRPASDLSGNVGAITLSDGAVDTGATDIFNKTVTFTTLPTGDTFDITYTAAADKIEDSHINALQNAVMQIQSSLGLTSPVDGYGTGISTMPIATLFNPSSLAELQSIQAFMPNVILLQHLTEDTVIGSTTNASLPSPGAGGITLNLGSTGALNRDSLVLDFDEITVQALNGTTGGVFNYSSNTGDQVGFSGVTDFASQVTIGRSYGALVDSYEDTVPSGAGAFYSGAALRVHGGIWFGSGLSGNGQVTIVNLSGEALTVVGEFHGSSLLIDNEATLNGPTTFNSSVEVAFPGNFSSNNHIALNDRPDGNASKIDGLDPSYAEASLKHLPAVKSSVTSNVRPTMDTDYSNPNQANAKFHPQLGFTMYPVLGGWTFTGSTLFEKAAVGTHRNVVLLQCDLDAVAGLGGGTFESGSYCTGMFNPGDTYIEFDIDNGNKNKLSYPIYYHTTEGYSSSTLTGLNVYLAADDEVFEDGTSIAGSAWRMYQPGNVPSENITADFSVSTAPIVKFGNLNNSEYPTQDLGMVLGQAWEGGSNVSDGRPAHKRLAAGASASVDVTASLTKSIEGLTSATGVAYVYATTNPGNDVTLEGSIELRATPTPYGLASSNVFQGGHSINPGQDCPVGEVWASTTDSGVNWSLIEVASYRADAFYDSGWVPMVSYIESGAAPDMGRCLPITGSQAGIDYVSTEKHYNFFVEHNLGPVRGGLTDFDFKVWVSRYKSMNYSGQQSDNNPDTLLYQQTSAGDMNLWTPMSMPYSTTLHEHYQSHAGDRGALVDITDIASINMLDSRFAMVSIDSNPVGDATIEDNEYIRVYFRRNR